MLKNSKVYVAETKNKGKGLFATCDIKKNEVIFIVKGKIRKEDKWCGSQSIKRDQDGLV
ncbi:SET domain-containing protein [Candidatus Woesearchaeota archaeon]|nr:SET domain-containing protein [Candidatus Woesearchaeota archaeon]